MSNEEDKRKTGGLEFMALRYNVIDKKLELAITKQITPTENNLLTLIELGTIGARNQRHLICSKAEFNLVSLSKNLGYKEVDKLWLVLKSIHKKNLIIREKTPYKGLEILGLNPQVFGQVLIDKSQRQESMRHLKLVPKQPTNRMESTYEPSVVDRQFVGDSLPNRRLIGENPIEIIEENSLLDSSRTSKTLKGEDLNGFDPKGPEKVRAIIGSIFRSMPS